MESIISHSFDSQDSIDVCPICLLPPSKDLKFCTAPCSHCFCVPDAERVLLTKQRVPTEEARPDPYLSIPTLGRCPICRQGISLFDLTIDTKCLYEKNADMLKWPVAGKTYAERGGLCVSFQEQGRPTLSWKNSQETEEKVTFEPGSHFHSQSRTFHGQFLLDEAHAQYWSTDTSRCLSVIFQFSSDLRYIAVGAVLKTGGEHGVVLLLGSTAGTVLYSVELTRTQTRPAYHGRTLWGNTFCQGFKVGLASYHFIDAQEGAFISYEHPLTSQWPPLDDGSPVPARVFFRKIDWNEGEREFSGEICWLQDYGTTWQGFQKWIYKMSFDANYTFIASGTVHSLMSDSEELHDMSTFGHDLIYINASVDQRFTRLTDESSTEEEEISDRFQRLSLPLRQEWASQGASVRVVAMLHQALTRVVMGQQSPVDFNLAS